MTDSLFLYRGTGLRKTITFRRKSTLEPIDCTGCSAEAHLRKTLGTDEAPILALSTDTPATGLGSGLAWEDEAAGQLSVIIGEDDSTDPAKFPRVTSTDYQQKYFMDVVVRDENGVPKFGPVRLDPILTETATED